MIEVQPTSDGSERLRLRTCPGCGVTIECSVWKHILDEHDPEDFGLGNA